MAPQLSESRKASCSGGDETVKPSDDELPCCLVPHYRMHAPSNPNDSHPPISPTLWVIIALMVASVAINYIDRGSLSTAGPLLITDLALSPAQLGWLLSAFFWSYALLQVASGWLVDRFEVKWVMAIGFTIWSLATAATGLANSFVTLFMFESK